MKKMHLIVDSSFSEIGQQIRHMSPACEEAGIELVIHDVACDGMLQTDLLGKNDLLYRFATTRRGRTLERLLISGECAHLYENWKLACSARASSYFIHNKEDLPVIPTHSYLPKNEQEMDACLAAVGPFPIIVKVTGNMMGVGVIRVDSLESFRSLRDYLGTSNASCLVRKYVPHEYHIRVAVLGGKVLGAYACYKKEGDFRTNLESYVEQRREKYDLSARQESDAIRAVSSLGLEFGGVDLLIAADGSHYIAEVNFPFAFQEAQRETGVDIGKALVEHLLAKSGGA